ncbi:MAG: phosphatase PAP2 family protein [Gemmatimonadaceae bacterium]|nr:phosphatase PAP2 family protein [Gemmatimonadaceae bacterium]
MKRRRAGVTGTPRHAPRVRCAVPATIATLLLTVLGCAEPHVTLAPPVEAEAANWPTLVLPRAGALRPAAPPAEGSTQAARELDEIVALQRSVTAVSDSVLRLHEGDPTSLWTRTAVDLLGVYWTILPDVRVATPARSARLMALLHAATYDAVLATWDAKWAYRRRSPAEASDRVRLRVSDGAVPSYPSEHAAVAAAARAILAANALPGDTARLRALMREAGEARMASGAAYRSDVEAGYALGEAVARRVLQRSATDGADKVWDGVMPTGAYVWQPTPARRVKVPFDALAGTWQTWVIPSGSAFRPPPFPVPGSAAWLASMNELRMLAAGGRTVVQMDRARFWATEAPTARWDLFVEEELARRRWSLPRAARARVWVSIAMYDAFVACWDAKFHYWLARPITVDPSLNTIFSTPPFPSYPSGHSTISNAAAQVMNALFPEKSREWDDLALEASNSRVWSGVHYRFDIEAGETLGATVGKAVVARMQGDGVR